MPPRWTGTSCAPPPPTRGVGCVIIAVIALLMLGGIAITLFGFKRSVSMRTLKPDLPSVNGTGSLDPDKAPVEFSPPLLAPASSAAMGTATFSCNIKNVSHVEISIVQAVVVFLDESGKPLEGQQPLSFGEAGGIAPRETFECKFAAENENARQARIVLKDVVYTYIPEGERMEMYEVSMKWTNKKFDEELKAARVE